MSAIFRSASRKLERHISISTLTLALDRISPLLPARICTMPFFCQDLLPNEDKKGNSGFPILHPLMKKSFSNNLSGKELPHSENQFPRERDSKGEELEAKGEKRVTPRHKMHSLPTAVIVGRPNVGKSKLFNRLTQRDEAIVYNTPLDHVTRDHREGVGKIGDLRLRFLDTAGLEPVSEDGSVLSRTAGITRDVLQQCQVVLFLIDGRAGIHPLDEEVGLWLRKSASNVTVLLLVNKCEGFSGDMSGKLVSAVAESHKLGFSDPIPISAETGEGLSDVYDRLQPLVDNYLESVKEEIQRGGSLDAYPEEQTEIPLQLAICGRPNVGKSTLLNQLLGRERALTGPEPGLTRDSIRDKVEFNGREIWLVDTAGWIQRAEMAGKGPDAMSAQDARRRLRRAQVVTLVLDASDIAHAKVTLKRSEMALARWIVLEGKALVVLVNKMDLLDASDQARVKRQLVTAVPQEIHAAIPQIGNVPILLSSALKEEIKDELLTTVEESYGRWCTRLTTGVLNRWLGKVKARNTIKEGFGSKVRYITQTKARPPTFVAFTSGSKPLPDSDMRFLGTNIREDFGLDGVPVRVYQRHTPRKKMNNL